MFLLLKFHSVAFSPWIGILVLAAKELKNMNILSVLGQKRKVATYLLTTCLFWRFIRQNKHSSGKDESEPKAS